jgi:hypothetical protein
VKGLEGFNRASRCRGRPCRCHVNGRQALRRGARLWTVATATFKAETYRFLRIWSGRLDEIARWACVPGRHDPPARLGRQRMAEAAGGRAAGHVRDKRGYARQEWQKLRERNEALDARVYARAAAWIADRRGCGGAGRHSCAASPCGSALLAARYSGTRSVSYDGKSITYGSDAELAAAIADIERRIAALERGSWARACAPSP